MWNRHILATLSVRLGFDTHTTCTSAWSMAAWVWWWHCTYRCIHLIETLGDKSGGRERKKMRMKIVKIEFQSESLLIKKCASPNKRPSTSPPKLHCTWHLCWASGHATDVWDPSEGSMSAEMEDMCIVSNMWDRCIDAKNEGRQKWMIVEWRWQVHHGILCTSSSIIKKVQQHWFHCPNERTVSPFRSISAAIHIRHPDICLYSMWRLNRLRSGGVCNS